jgi:hypothetical protein
MFSVHVSQNMAVRRLRLNLNCTKFGLVFKIEMTKLQYQTMFEVLTAVNIKTSVFWVVMVCHLFHDYDRFRGKGH